MFLERITKSLIQWLASDLCSKIEFSQGAKAIIKTMGIMFFNCCSSTIVSIFTPSPTHPHLNPQTHPLWLCPCVLHTCSLMPPPIIPIIPLPTPLWLNEWIKTQWYIYSVEYYAAERKKELLDFTTA